MNNQNSQPLEAQWQNFSVLFLFQTGMNNWTAEIFVLGNIFYSGILNLNIS